MILIVGGMGFIGLNLARELAQIDSVTLTTHRSRRPRRELADLVGAPVEAAAMDMADPQSVMEVFAEARPDAVVHLAAPPIGAVPVADEAIMNIVGLINVLAAARAADVRRVCVASSIDVYAGIPCGPYVEDQPLPVNSVTATSAMKKAEEVLGMHHADRTGLDMVIVRLGNVYGPLYRSMYSLAGQLMHAAIKGRPVDAAEGRWDAERLAHGLDLCHVRDCATAIAALITAKRLAHRVYNIGGGECVGVPALLDAVRASAPNVEIPPLLDQIGFDARAGRVMDIGRICAELGWAPRYPIAAGVAYYAEWLREHAY